MPETGPSASRPILVIRRYAPFFLRVDLASSGVSTLWQKKIVAV